MSSKSPNRLIVVTQIYHARVDENPRNTHVRYGRKIESDEQQYGPRECKAGETWIALDTMWVKEPSLIILHHLLPRGTKPGTVQLEIGVFDPVVSCVIPTQAIHAGEGIPIHPYHNTRYAVRASKGTVQYSITAIPS